MMTNQWNGMKSDLAVFHRGPRQASTQRTGCMLEATKRPTKLGVCRDKLAPLPLPPLASADADPAADAVVVDMKWCGCWVGSVWSRLCWLCVCVGGVLVPVRNVNKKRSNKQRTNRHAVTMIWTIAKFTGKHSRRNTSPSLSCIWVTQ